MGKTTVFVFHEEEGDTKMIVVKCLLATTSLLSIVLFASATLHNVNNELSDHELSRVYGEGIPGTYCTNQQACTVPNTCAYDGNGGCRGSGGCQGQQNRICVYGSYTICTQTPIQTCCISTNCILAYGEQGQPICVQNTVPAGPQVGSRNNC